MPIQVNKKVLGKLTRYQDGKPVFTIGGCGLKRRPGKLAGYIDNRPIFEAARLKSSLIRLIGKRIIFADGRPVFFAERDACEPPPPPTEIINTTCCGSPIALPLTLSLTDKYGTWTLTYRTRTGPSGQNWNGWYSECLSYGDFCFVDLDGYHRRPMPVHWFFPETGCVPVLKVFITGTSVNGCGGSCGFFGGFCPEDLYASTLDPFVGSNPVFTFSNCSSKIFTYQFAFRIFSLCQAIYDEGDYVVVSV